MKQAKKMLFAGSLIRNGLIGITTSTPELRLPTLLPTLTARGSETESMLPYSLTSITTMSILSPVMLILNFGSDS